MTMTVVDDSPSRKSGGQQHYGATGTSAPTNVQVIAPATLSAGHIFEAMYENVIFDVTVPEGGVVKGQRFIVPFIPPPPPAAVATAIVDGEGDEITFDNTVAATASDGRRHNNTIPMGKWRDNLFDCFHYGFFHPALWCACLFKPCLMGQLLTRMKMSWLGHRSHKLEPGGRGSNLDDSRVELDERWRYSFRNVLVITTLFFVVTTFLSSMEEQDIITPPMDEGEDFDEYIQRVVSEAINDNDEDDPTIDAKDSLVSSINSFLSFLYGTYITYMMIQLRATMRHVYAIPEQSCKCWYALFGGSQQHQRLSNGGNVCENCEYISERCCTADVPVGWEDMCCSFWCQCCVLGQMARHTVNYDERNALCCNEVGVNNWDEDEAYDGVDKMMIGGEGSVLIV